MSVRSDAEPGVRPVLDDIDARPGSTASLLRTIIGLYLRRIGGWISAADLVALAADLGIPSGQARTGIARLKKKGLLVSERADAIGYRVSDAAIPMLERGDRRIFDVRLMRDDDPWCLVSISIPESRRDLRHQLRRRLQFIGCGVVAPALWVCPWHLHDEVEEILDELGARSGAVVFRTRTPSVAGSLAAAAATWWDLGALRVEHELFQATVADFAQMTDEHSGDAAFAAYVRLIDGWRVLPYRDPGLPPSLLPTDWPGQRSFDLHAGLSARFAEPAWQHVCSAVG